MRPAPCCVMRTTAKSPPSWRAPRARAAAPSFPTGSASACPRGGRTSPGAATWTASTTRCWRSLLSGAFALALAGCGAAGGKLDLVGATWRDGVPPVIELRLETRFTPELLAALDQGIPLTLRIALELDDGRVRIDSTRHLELSY